MNKWLIGIILLSSVLRLAQLSSVPPGLSLDEVSIGYNAYSILKTGKDEFGTFFPVLLRAYDDYRPALYVYLVIPFVKLLGLTGAAVRFPSVVLSIATVVLAYYLAKILVNKQSIAYLTSLLLAISPWHIYISRLGHEVNLGLFANVAASYFFLKGSTVLSGIFFAVALYSYQSQKAIVPLMLFGLALRYRKKVLLTTIIASLLVLPLIKASLSRDALVRFTATSAFAPNQPQVRESREAFAKAKLDGNIIGQIVHNRYVTYGNIFWTNYISHAGPKWLFWGSNRESHKVPNMGLFYWWELPTVIIGLWLLRNQKKYLWYILLWFIVSPVPAAVTTQAPHAMRAISLIPYIHIVSALGLGEVIKKFRVATILTLCLSLIFFIRQYFWIFPKFQSDSFQHALAESVTYTISQEGRFSKIVFSNRLHLSQSYMFYLFYSSYDPGVYQESGGTTSGGFEQPHKIGNIEFRAIDWKHDKDSTGVLFIGNPADFDGANIAKKFYYLDGTLGAVAVEK